MNKKNTSSISSSEKRWEEFNISASLFPSSSYLEKFLQVQRSDQTKLELAQENNLYWFCTAGKFDSPHPAYFELMTSYIEFAFYCTCKFIQCLSQLARSCVLWN